MADANKTGQPWGDDVVAIAAMVEGLEAQIARLKEELALAQKMAALALAENEKFKAELQAARDDAVDLAKRLKLQAQDCLTAIVAAEQAQTEIEKLKAELESCQHDFYTQVNGNAALLAQLEQSAERQRELAQALDRSVKLQSHYAALLN